MAILAIERIDDNTVEGTFRSDISGRMSSHILKITKSEIDEWLQKQSISVFKSLSNSEKELFITGITSDEWDSMFSNEEEYPIEKILVKDKSILDMSKLQLDYEAVYITEDKEDDFVIINSMDDIHNIIKDNYEFYIPVDDYPNTYSIYSKKPL